MGSLRLAILLLLSIAGSIGFATFMESRFDQAVAAYYIYNAVWFKIWLLLLCANLTCAALTRWPWQPRHYGFVVTHAGIITLLIGAEIGQILGFEAFVDLDKSTNPVNHLTTKQEILTLQGEIGPGAVLPFNLEFSDVSPGKPQVVKVPDTNYALVINKTSNRLTVEETIQPAKDPLAPEGVNLHVINETMKQDLPAILLGKDGADEFDLFGMATIRLVDSLPDPDQPAPAAARRDATPFHETHLIFAEHPRGPVVDTDADVMSGYHFILFPPTGGKGATKPTLEILEPGEASKPIATLPLPTVSGTWLEVPTAKGKHSPLLFRVGAYWPDFYMNGNKPATASQNPNHPAALIQLMGPTAQLPAADSTTTAIATPARPNPPASISTLPGQPVQLTMLVALGTRPGTLIYQVFRNANMEQQGVAKLGETITPGWSKWKVRVQGVEPHGEVHREVREVEAESTAGAIASTGSPVAGLLPGLRAYLVSTDDNIRQSEDTWILAGTSREIFTKTDYVRVGFGQATIPLDFSVRLLDFQVPRDEGTETPADYISTLEFKDLNTGHLVHDVAHMNIPAMYPGDWWRSLLGWNLKFSQANWNPENLNQTTLQVLYDPGWPLKGLGSLCICAGITMMFYFRPGRSKGTGREEEGEAVT